MIRLPIAAVCAIFILATGSASAQALQSEISITGGASSEDVRAAAGQLRVFGEPSEHFRFFVEGAWGARSREGTDAFGSAYPYDRELHPMEAYGETTLRRGRFMTSVRAGQYRTPFGLYGRGEHAYGGFLRAPLIRYDGYFAISNNFLDAGVNIIAGLPNLYVETSLGVPQDAGISVRPTEFAPMIRAQAYYGPFIVGGSYLRGRPYDRRSFVRGNMEFTGVDLRFMHSGIQVRGEWLNGGPFDRATTDGVYIDTIVHRPQFGPVTLVFRAEYLDYEAGLRSSHDTRYTGGARVELPRGFVANVNLLHAPKRSNPTADATALDVALTWVLRVP